MGKRKYVWIDAIEIDTPVQVAAGVVSSVDVVSETELENLGSVTLERIVGRIIVYPADAVAAQYAVVLFKTPKYVGAGLPTGWDKQDTYERSDNLWSDIGRTSALGANRDAYPQDGHVLDWRSKRKIQFGTAVELAVQNVNLGAIQYIYHLRFLLALP